MGNKNRLTPEFRREASRLNVTNARTRREIEGPSNRVLPVSEGPDEVGSADQVLYDRPFISSHHGQVPRTN